jgi:hypothetical protein
MKLLNQKQLAILLLGILTAPFLYLSFPRLPGSADPALGGFSREIALHGYCVLVVSFVAGIQWGIHFSKRTEDSVYLVSFLSLALAWVSLLAAGTMLGLSLMLLVVLLAWLEDRRMSKQRVTTLWFWQVRCASSGVICLSLMLAIADLAGR